MHVAESYTLLGEILWHALKLLELILAFLDKPKRQVHTQGLRYRERRNCGPPHFGFSPSGVQSSSKVAAI